MKKIIVLTGAGISAESGLKTFRDSGGLWEEYEVSEVATPEAWQKNPARVQEFYNKRRKQVMNTLPNAAHYALVKLESGYDVHIITQNIDDLHERAGSTHVLHLHGEIMKACSTADPGRVYTIDGWELKMGERCEKGSQLRPHVVWFGEIVPNMAAASKITASAEILLVIGTSLNVYPAAGLLDFAEPGVPVYLIDPHASDNFLCQNYTAVKEKAGTGVPRIVDQLLKQAGK